MTNQGGKATDALRARLTYANLMSSVAVFIALGGVSYAALRIPNNSVGTKQIKNRAVTKPKLDPHLLASLAGKTGPQGLPGAQGLKGDAGAQGPSGQSVQGPPGSARAYAVVDPSNCTGGPPAVCTVSRSKGISSVVRWGTGIYCVTAPGISSSDEPAIVSVDWSSTVAPQSIPTALYNNDPTVWCPVSGDFSIVTQRPTAFNAQTTTNDVGFVVAIP